MNSDEGFAKWFHSLDVTGLDRFPDDSLGTNFQKQSSKQHTLQTARTNKKCAGQPRRIRNEGLLRARMYQKEKREHFARKHRGALPFARPRKDAPGVPSSRSRKREPRAAGKMIDDISRGKPTLAETHHLLRRFFWPGVIALSISVMRGPSSPTEIPSAAS